MESSNILLKLYKDSAEIKKSVGSTYSILDKVYGGQVKDRKREEKQNAKDERDRKRQEQAEKRKRADWQGFKKREKKDKKKSKGILDFLKDAIGPILGALGPALAGIGPMLGTAVAGLIPAVTGAIAALGPALVVAMKGLAVGALAVATAKTVNTAADRVYSQVGLSGTTTKGTRFNLRDIVELQETQRKFYLDQGINSEQSRARLRQFDALTDAMRRGKSVNDQLYDARQRLEEIEKRLGDDGISRRDSSALSRHKDDLIKKIQDLETNKEANANKMTQLFKELQITDEDLVQRQVKSGRRDINALPDHIKKDSIQDRSWTGHAYHSWTFTDYGDAAIQKQTGGHIDVPGSGTGDKVPMLLPAGSFVLNRTASRHFQNGGMVPTLLEPGEKVFAPGDWDSSIANLNSAIGRFQTGGSVGRENKPTKKGEARNVATLLEPGEKVFLPGQWNADIMNMNSAIPRFQKGGVVEHLHGDPQRPGYEPAGHGKESNAHDHYAFSSRNMMISVKDSLVSKGYNITEWNGEPGHAPGGFHYANGGSAFDVPWSQFGSGPVGEGDFKKSRKLAEDVKSALSSAGGDPGTVSHTGGAVESGGGTGSAAVSSTPNPGLGNAGAFLSEFSKGISGDLGLDLFGGSNLGSGSAVSGGGGSSSNGGGTSSPGGAFGESSLIKSLNDKGITNKNERAMFLAQMAHESGNFKYDEEIHDGSNYEGRSDLGNNQPGDGKRFKGRGYIQLTGRSNYSHYGSKVGQDLVGNPDLAKDPNIAAAVAMAYWGERVNRTAAQKGDVLTVTRNINGGTNGLADREAKYKQYSAKGLQRGGVVGISKMPSSMHDRFNEGNENFNRQLASNATSNPIVIGGGSGGNVDVNTAPEPNQKPPILPDGPSSNQAADYFYRLNLGGVL